MKRWLLFGPLLSLSLAAAVVFAFNAGAFHSLIEQKAAEKSGAKIHFGTMRIAFRLPVTLVIGASKIDSALAQITWEELQVSLTRVTPPYGVALTLNKPTIVMQPNMEIEKAPTPAEAPGREASSSAVAPRVQVKILNGEFQSGFGKVSRADVDFEQKALMQSLVHIHLKALVEANSFPVAIPIAIDSDALALSPEQVKATDLKLSLGGLEAKAQGTSFIKEDRHRWRVTIAAEDLAKLPKPPFDIPAENWKGAVHSQIELTKAGPQHSWDAEGDISAVQVSALVKWKKDKILVQGPVALDLKTHFQYLNATPIFSDLKGSVDFTAARVFYENKINKAEHVPLQVSVLAKGDASALELDGLDFQFWNLKGHLSGRAKLKAPYEGEVHFSIPPVSLSGAESVFLPLASSPVKGQLGFEGSLSGPLEKPLEAHLNLKSFKIKDLSATFNEEQGMVLNGRGHAELSVEGSADVDHGKFIRVSATGRANLKDLAMTAGPYRKEAGQDFLLSFQLRNNQEQMEIQNLKLDGHLGHLKISGYVTDLAHPDVKLVVSAHPLDLNELRISLPEWREKIPKGLLNADLQLQGTRSEKGNWSDWPLNVSGDLKIHIPEYVVVNNQNDAKEKAPVEVGQVPKPPNPAILPGGYLTSHLKLKIAVDVDTVKKDSLTILKAHSEGQIANSHFRGNASVAKIFNGSLTAENLDVPLLEGRPALQGRVAWKEIAIQQALAYAKPDSKDLASGVMGGHAEFMSYLPSDEGFLGFLKVKGEVVAQPVTLYTVRVGEMINDLAKQAPILKIKPVQVAPMHGYMKMQFDLRNQTLHILNFDAQDADTSELKATGKVALPSLQGDLLGDFFWAKPQVQGCLLEGNSDAQGRMVIPLAIKGDLMHPGLSSLSDLISKMGGKLLQCEQKKLVERVKKEGTQKLQEELTKKLQGLFH